ncbi:hypothetical protein Ssi03_41400 [Sphaerisporangium siamense]|uniref:Pimeloyl-ACP methyl ester carboxylesterase n=1 Tax=Sphaerisporangium siamense TaxID=795645 RepID=A0A7W7DFS1_9ACTN|nr:alpha/beta hydrolase [Sphaerisporangium siamense]MBB4704538.1 pimeloyl-ACP methyl ester carboxylesterase [Sphaerisporangium siamense]GII86150.1 hypothetical protein Ssi03_41400 [Sphaerisporangium siamense]
MRPGYVTLPSGQVHLRQAGTGTPVLLIHDAPGSSAGWDPALVDAVAGRRWVIAPDLIGFGGTTLDDADAGDLGAQADALAAAMAVLGVRRVPVAGEGAGAAVAARLAQRHPDLVSVVLTLHAPYSGEDAPEASPSEDGGAQSGRGEGSGGTEPFTPGGKGGEPFVMDASGGHLVRLFDEVRDSLVFSPWWRPVAGNRRRRGLPSPEVLHALFLDTAAHGDAHRRLVASAARAWPRLVAACDMAVAGDDPAADILALPEGEATAGAGQPSAGEMAAGAEEPSLGETAGRPSGGERGYVPVGAGVVHVRRFGGRSSGRRPVLLLHANPGSGAGLEPLARALGETRPAIVWDTPGHGRSTPLPVADGMPAGAGGAGVSAVDGTLSGEGGAGAPVVDGEVTLAGAYVPVLVVMLDALGIDRCDVYGTHTGAGLAVELAVAAPERVGALVLDGVPLFDDRPELVASVMANYFVDLTPDTHGSHLRRAWGASADMALWWPWFEHTPAGIRDVDAYRPEFLQRVVLDMLRSAPHYHRYYRAAWQWPCSARLPLVRRPVLVGSTRTDPLAPMTPVALRLLGDAGNVAETTFAPLGALGSPEANAALIARYLDEIS